MSDRNYPNHKIKRFITSILTDFKVLKAASFESGIQHTESMLCYELRSVRQILKSPLVSILPIKSTRSQIYFLESAVLQIVQNESATLQKISYLFEAKDYWASFYTSHRHDAPLASPFSAI